MTALNLRPTVAVLEWHSILRHHLRASTLLPARKWPMVLFALQLLVAGWAFPAVAAQGLRATTNLGGTSATRIVAPAAGQPVVLEETPLRLEYQLITRVEHMTQTTRDIRAVVDGMPGPGLPSDAASPPLLARFADPYQEMLARLDHAALLVADISAILQRMPDATGARAFAQAGQSATAVPKTAASLQQQPVPINRRKPPPLTPTTFVRIAIVMLGVLLAFALVRQLPKLRRKTLATDNTALELPTPPAAMLPLAQDQITSTPTPTASNEPEAKAA